jgi:hypothetical protein
MARGDLKNLSPGVRAVARAPVPDNSCMGNSVARFCFFKDFFQNFFRNFRLRGRNLGSITFDLATLQTLRVHTICLFDIPYAGVYCRGGYGAQTLRFSDGPYE